MLKKKHMEKEENIKVLKNEIKEKEDSQEQKDE